MGTTRWPIIGISGRLEYLESGFLPGVVQPEFPAPLYGTQERWGPCELTPLAHQLFEAAERVNAGLVVMDSVAAIYLANENDRAEVRGFLSALARRGFTQFEAPESIPGSGDCRPGPATGRSSTLGCTGAKRMVGLHGA